jgi:hypothetical protein
MANGTIVVALTKRHNTGNYEHTEAKVEITLALAEGEDPAAAAVLAQRRILPLVSLEHLNRLPPVPARDLGEAPHKTQRVEPSASPAQSIEDVLGKTAETAVEDPLAEPKRGRGRPPGSKNRPKTAEADPLVEPAPKAAEADPLAEPAPKAAEAEPGQPDGRALRARVIAWAAASPETHATLNRTLSVTGYARLTDVPAAELPDLLATLGITP